MCDSCNRGHSSRWGSTRLVFLALLVTLLALSAIGATTRLTGASDSGRACREATAAAIAFQAAVTRDRLDHPRLHAHTRAFENTVVALGATRCPETIRFIQATRPSLAGLCGDCVIGIADARRSSA